MYEYATIYVLHYNVRPESKLAPTVLEFSLIRYGIIMHVLCG